MAHHTNDGTVPAEGSRPTYWNMTVLTTKMKPIRVCILQPCGQNMIHVGQASFVFVFGVTTLRKEFVILELYWWLFSSTKLCS